MRLKGVRVGVMFNSGAVWIGAHWSPFNRRWCVNLVPCVTVWVVLKDGKPPERASR